MARRYLVYGGSGAMGRAISLRLRTRGAELILVGRNRQRLVATAAEVGGDLVAGDVRDPALFEEVTDRLGDAPLAGLVYAVGTINLRPLSRLSDEDFLTDFEVNALGAARAVRGALRALSRSEDGSSVLLFSSIAARQGFPGHASIGMAKAAVEGLTVSLAAELAPRIRVNALAPSLTLSAMSAGMTGNEAMAKAIAGLHPLGRLGAPGDVAALADVLLTDAGSWITGQVIGVDGGRSTLRAKG